MSGYIGTQPVPQATQTRDAFTATSGQTSFATSGYTPNFLDVFLNGVKLAAADYTASNGSDVVLATGATTGDILEVVAYSSFEVVTDTVTNAGTVLNLDRTGSDGTILDLKKDGTTVGSISSKDGANIIVGSSNCGLSFQTGTVRPRTMANGTSNGVNDLGTSGSRFKDLYLSGGVVFGDAGGSGTSSSNSLDDYEEGTFTPVLSDVSAGGNLATVANVRANYTKTGNQVNVCLNLNNITTTGMTAGNGFYIQGLPFTAPSYTTPNLNYVGSVRLQNILYSGYAVSEVQDNTSNIMVKEVLSGVGSNRLLVSDIASGTADISISLTYETT